MLCHLAVLINCLYMLNRMNQVHVQACNHHENS